MQLYLTSASEKALPEPVLPVLLTDITENGVAVSTVAGAVAMVDPTQIAQNARSGLTVDLLSCNEALSVQAGPLPWASSPTRLALGDDWLRYDEGAVIGNWVLMTGVLVIGAGVAHKMGFEVVQFPGALILPTFFLISSTFASSIALLREGAPGQQAIGCLSMSASLVGISIVALRLSPRFFQAQWDEENCVWVDRSESQTGWVLRYGKLFDSYIKGRQGYVVIELLTSIAVGTLKSYQILEQNCATLLWSGAAVYDLYALSQIALHPHRDRYAQIFYSTVATLQAVALTTQAIASVSSSEETQEQVKVVTQSIVTATRYVMMVKTLLGVGLRAKDWFDRFRQSRLAPPLSLEPEKLLKEALPEVSVFPSTEPLVNLLLSDQGPELLAVDEGSSIEQELRSMQEVLSADTSLRSEEGLQPTLMVQDPFSFGLSSIHATPRTLNEAIEHTDYHLKTDEMLPINLEKPL
ncbi:MAG: hypothetical protein I8H75_02050 [Myxococcaceae bacterium]|nr:hypothetical protein [Myxococcaceae bacterium]MBH2006118.1 hypothetical protein [Myxococcaceae bacterium]